MNKGWNYVIWKFAKSRPLQYGLRVHQKIFIVNGFVHMLTKKGKFA